MQYTQTSRGGGGGPPPTSAKQPPDPALLKPSLTTSVTGLRQALTALKSATKEVQRYMLDEASIIYECKTCRNMFRSLANLIAHKRAYCCTEYSRVKHVFTDKQDCAVTPATTVVVEAEAIETVVSSTPWDISQYSSSLNLLKEASIFTEVEEKPVVNRLLPPRKVGIQGVIERLTGRLEPQERMQAVVLEPIKENPNAFFQTVKEIRTMGSDYREEKRDKSETVVVGPSGLQLPRGATGVTEGLPATRPVSPSGSDNSKENVREEVEEDLIARYPCPLCKKEPKDFSKLSNCFYHLETLHGKSYEEARKYKKRIKAGKRMVSRNSVNRYGKAKKADPVPEPAKTGGKKVSLATNTTQQSHNTVLAANSWPAPPPPEALTNGSRGLLNGGTSSLPLPPAIGRRYAVVAADGQEGGGAALRLAMAIGLVNQQGVGLQKVNPRIHEVWETKEDIAKAKSREERRLARQRQEEERRREEGEAEEEEEEGEDTEISFNMERLSPQEPKPKKAKFLSGSSYRSGEFTCVVCDKNFRTATFLNQHLSASHFKHELQEDFRADLQRKRCSFCGATFEVVHRLLVHLGATHKMVERYISQSKSALEPESPPRPLPHKRPLGRPPKSTANPGSPTTTSKENTSGKILTNKNAENPTGSSGKNLTNGIEETSGGKLLPLAAATRGAATAAGSLVNGTSSGVKQETVGAATPTPTTTTRSSGIVNGGKLPPTPRNGTTIVNIVGIGGRVSSSTLVNGSSGVASSRVGGRLPRHASGDITLAAAGHTGPPVNIVDEIM